jgi:hypothetical protein
MKAALTAWVGAGQAEKMGCGGHGHVDRQKQPSAQVSKGVSQARYLVDSPGRSHVGKQGVVKHIGA